MNWDAIGAIGEIVGATGVIVTLIYLAVQIRQNTSATNRTNVRNVLESNNSALSSLLDESVSEIFVRGLKSLEGLNEVERYRFDNAFYNGLVLASKHLSINVKAHFLLTALLSTKMRL